jgi:hypothetical protein
MLNIPKKATGRQLDRFLDKRVRFAVPGIIRGGKWGLELPYTCHKLLKYRA